MNGFIGSVAERTADPDTVVISKVAADFTDYHWNERYMSRKPKGAMI